MKKTFIFFLIFTIFSNCQENKNTSKNSKMETYNGLIENLNLEHCLFQKKDIELKKYKYTGIYIEDLDINRLLERDYREKFFDFLKNKSNDDDFKSTLFCKLLLIRIQQLKDSNSFFLLSEMSKSTDLSYDGIELLGDSLVELFIDNPIFFIQQGAKYNDREVNNYIMVLFKDFIVDKKFFDENLGAIDPDEKVLLLNPKMEKDFTDGNLVNKLKKMPKVEVSFSPSLYTAWESKTISFTDIYEVFEEMQSKKISVGESNYYNLVILPKLNDYIIQDQSKSNYSIQDSDGFTNLRKEKNSTSEILQKINTGEKIEVKDNSGDWFLVKTKEGKEGYVHRSRIKSN